LYDYLRTPNRTVRLGFRRQNQRIIAAIRLTRMI